LIIIRAQSVKAADWALLIWLIFKQLNNNAFIFDVMRDNQCTQAFILIIRELWVLVVEARSINSGFPAILVTPTGGITAPNKWRFTDISLRL
jgi:hypothetical protein